LSDDSKIISSRSIWSSVAFLVFFTLFFYLPVLNNDFINVDDTDAILQNTQIRFISFSSLKWMFTTFHMGFWIPLTWLSLAIDYRLGGLNPMIFHAHNLALHVLNTVLVFFLCLKVLRLARKPHGPEAGIPQPPWELPGAFLAAVLFGLHPIHVESVAWAVERKDVLYSFFFLLGLLVYLDWASAPTRKAWKLLACLGLFSLSLMAKPMAVTFPLVLLLLDAWPLARFSANCSKVLLEKIPFFLLSILSGILTVMAHSQAGAVMAVAKYPLDFRIANAFHSLIFYFWKMLWPANLSALYPVGIGEKAFTLENLGAAALVLLATLACFWQWKKRPYLAVAFLFYVITLAPVLGILQVGSQAAADRFTYLASLGPILLLAALTAGLLQNRRLVAFLLAIGLAFVLGFGTARQANIWRNSVVLWENAVRLSPFDSYVAHTFLAQAYDSVGRTDDALSGFNKAIEIGPPDAVPHNGKAVALCSKGKLEESIPEFKTSIVLNPQYRLPHLNLWIVYQRSGRYEESLGEALEAVRINPDSAQAYDLLGISYGDLKQFDKSIESFQKALSLEPDNPEFRRHLAATTKRAANPKEPMDLYQKELEGR
jgi:protein O-mannosyl-transferase